MTDNNNKKTIFEFQKTQAEVELAKLNENLSHALKIDAECQLINKQIEFAQNAQNIVSDVEKEMMEEVRMKMQQRTMDYFNALIWKKGVYDHIELNKNYRLDLLHRDGYSCVGSCSAAEKSLLALSFTLALHEVSGFNAMLFIDTPVARVSGQNRINFSNVLKDVSKYKQLIMTLTPDEYSEPVKFIFEPIASTISHLVMNTNSEITTIQ